MVGLRSPEANPGSQIGPRWSAGTPLPDEADSPDDSVDLSSRNPQRALRVPR